MPSESHLPKRKKKTAFRRKDQITRINRKQTDIYIVAKFKKHRGKEYISLVEQYTRRVQQQKIKQKKGSVNSKTD